MKKFLAILLTLTLVLAFASCGGDTNKKTAAGVQQGTTGELYLKGDADLNFAGYENIECKSYTTAGLAAKAMIDGQIDYVIIDNEPAKVLVNQNPEIKMIDVALSAEEYAFGVDKAQDDIKTALNELITAMKNDGSLDALFEKYNKLEYDADGNVIGGDEDIVGIDSASKDNSNPAGQLVVATNAAFAPFEYKKGNQFAGIDIEIMQALANKLNLELVIEDMDFDAVVTSVGKNNIDVAASGLTIKESRKKAVNFSDCYYNGAYQVILVLKTNTEFDACTTKEQIEEILKAK